jgi:hypothetical protein
MPQRHDWTVALHDLLIEHWRDAGCLVCGRKPVAWTDILDIEQYGLSYVLCAGCRTQDPAADRARQVLAERYVPHGRKEKT